MSMYTLGARLVDHVLSGQGDTEGAPAYAVARLLAHHVDLGTWRVDLGLSKFHFSRKALDTFGLSDKDNPLSLKEAMAHFVHEDRKPALEALLEAVQKRCGFQVVARIRQRSGDVRIVDCIGDVECDAQGKVTAVVGVIKDVTLFNKHEVIAANRSMMMKSVLKHLPTAIAIFDSDLNYITANELWTAARNLPPARQLKGKSLYAFYEVPEEVKREHLTVLEGNTLWRERQFRRDEAGNPITQKTIIAPWYTGDRKVGGMMIMVASINPQVAAHRNEQISDRPTKAEFEDLLRELA